MSPAELGQRGQAEWRGVFESFPYGLVLADRDGRLLEANSRGTSVLGRSIGLADRSDHDPGPSTCCELVCEQAPKSALGGACLTEFALRNAEHPPEIRVDLGVGEQSTAAWVAAFSIGRDQPMVLFQLRPGSAFDRRQVAGLDLSSFPALKINALGGFEVEGPHGSMRGEWLNQRPGLLLKYLISERTRAVPSEQIAEALLPDTGRREALSCVRQYVHHLRACLEPDRPRRAPSLYVVTRKGGYALEGIWADVDEFEHRVEVGLREFRRGHEEGARDWLRQARDFYVGDFLPDDPYAEWARAERARLRELAGRMLRALVQLELRRSDIEAAAGHARDLAEMEPLDSDVQRGLLRICLRMGRHGEAVRRHDLFRNRLQRHFGQEPSFTLAELTE